MGWQLGAFKGSGIVRQAWLRSSTFLYLLIFLSVNRPLCHQGIPGPEFINKALLVPPKPPGRLPSTAPSPGDQPPGTLVPSPSLCVGTGAAGAGLPEPLRALSGGRPRRSWCCRRRGPGPPACPSGRSGPGCPGGTGAWASARGRPGRRRCAA